jgi:hypothetical protein
LLLAYPEASLLLGERLGRNRKRNVPRDRAWRDFIGDKALLERYNVGPRELEVLAQTNLLGRIIAPRDFLFIPNSIR